MPACTLLSCALTDQRSALQKRRSSRQVKRKRYTEDLEFRLSDEEVEETEVGAQKSPSNISHLESQVSPPPAVPSPPLTPQSLSEAPPLLITAIHQEAPDAEGPVVEKIMGMRVMKKQVRMGPVAASKDGCFSATALGGNSSNPARDL